ncbi:MAG TPA: ribokinase [Streptosporangiaceae bacterium]|nr:ribokinase [Streptosporangiaceae bacterium]
MDSRPRVTVLGSLNMDISVTVPVLPGPGVTVLGGGASFTPGGKGANQAVAAARLGADVRMAGCVGEDDFGSRLTATLKDEGIDATAVTRIPGAPTGLAMITVDAAGENIITVAPGANHQVGNRELDAIGDPGALVISAEIPLKAVREALALARRQRIRCLLNLAPAPPGLEARALVAEGVDWLVVNESEAEAVLGTPVRGLAEAGRAALALVTAGARTAVVTAGAHGAALAGAALAGAAISAPAPGTEDPPEAVTVPGLTVKAVDSVGAGDTFVGALATALAAGIAPLTALNLAVAAGATAVTRPGAQAGMPTRADILAVTGLRWPVT